MTIFTFDPITKTIAINQYHYTIKTATVDTNTVEINETIDPDVPPTGLLLMSAIPMIWPCAKDLTSGYDWSTNPEFLYISTSMGGPEQIWLTQNCATLNEVINHINDRLENGGLINHYRCIKCRAGYGEYAPTTNILFEAQPGHEGEAHGLRVHDPSDVGSDHAHFTIGISRGIHVGKSDEYYYTSWTGSTFTLDINLTETYTTDYNCAATPYEISILDMYSAAMDWADELVSESYDVPMSAVGKFSFGAGQYSDSIFTLLNGWKIRPPNGFFQEVFVGTIITDDESSLTVPPILGSVETVFRVSTHGVVFIPVTEGMIADAVWDTVLIDYTDPGTAGELMYHLGGTIVHAGYAQSSTDNTITLSTTASSSNGAYDPAEVIIIGGTGKGQCRLIYEYIGSTKLATVDRNWKVNPNTTSRYIIRANPGREHVNEGMSQGGTLNTITLNALASDSDDVYVGQTVFIRSGVGEDQTRLIIDYDGTSKIATVERDWDVTPNSTSGYVMLPIRVHTKTEIVNAVWSEASSGYTVVGTFGAIMRDIYQMTAGRWKIDTETNKMTFYDSNGTDALIVFDLKDELGQPSSTKVYERVPES